MATNLATVEKIEEVKNHPNADRLDLVRVLNFWAIVPRNKYEAGDLCVYIQPDSVLPSDREWAATFLPFTKKGRVRAVRLRGEWSEGIVVDIDLPVKEGYTIPEAWAALIEDGEGLSVDRWLGITKHEPPEFKHGLKEVKGYLPFDIPKTDENNWRKLRLEPFLGQPVDVTLKIDGQSFTAYCVYDEIAGDCDLGICSRSLDLKIQQPEDSVEELVEEYNSNWHRAERKYHVLDKLAYYCRMTNTSLALRGEVYGPGIQNFKHNPHSLHNELDVAFFSVWNIDEKRYEGPNDKHYYEKVCQELGLPTVPMLEKQVPLTYELLEKYDSQVTEVNGFPFEGVVIKGDDFHCKVINKFYDSEK